MLMLHKFDSHFSLSFQGKMENPKETSRLPTRSVINAFSKIETQTLKNQCERLSIRLAESQE